MNSGADQDAFTEQATEIVAAYVRHNSVPVAEVPSLIRSVHETLSRLDKPAATEAPVEQKRQPAVPIKRSVTDDYIISLEDGRKFKSMKRYLAGLGMTPADYRAKWGLPADYPMVAPNYAKTRSALAKESGLGQQRRKTAQEAAAPSQQPGPQVEAQTPKRGRKKAA